MPLRWCNGNTRDFGSLVQGSSPCGVALSKGEGGGRKGKAETISEEVKGVPSIEDIGPYKLFFYSSEGDEPPHVHVRRDRATAKFWLNPVRLARSRRFSDHELRELQRTVEENQPRILEAWNEHFGN